MASKNARTEMMDEEGISTSTVVENNRTVSKTFLLKRDTDENWPTDSEGKLKQIKFSVVVDMEGTTYADILSDAIATKIIRLQGALRKSGLPYEALAEMAKTPLRRQYASLGEGIESSAKTVAKIENAVENLTPEQLQELIAKLKAKQAASTGVTA